MPDIKWAEPPIAKWGGRRGLVLAFIDELKKRPGEWAMFEPERGHDSSKGAQMRTRYLGVETTVRKRPDNKYDVYVRWVGNGDEA